MREPIIILCAVAVAFAWMAIWSVALHASGILVWGRVTEERAHKRERLLRMGKQRYILIFGVFGSGLGLGLAMAICVLMEKSQRSWPEAIVNLALVYLVMRCFNGYRSWNNPFRDPVPFPPDYASLK